MRRSIESRKPGGEAKGEEEIKERTEKDMVKKLDEFEREYKERGFNKEAAEDLAHKKFDNLVENERMEEELRAMENWYKEQATEEEK